MKTIIEKSKVISLLFVLATVTLMSGCGKTENLQASSKEIAEQFLNEFFTSDFEGRCSDFLKNVNAELYQDIENMNTEEVNKYYDKCYDKYYDTFSDCTTQECIETMARNRIPLKYDRIAMEKDMQVKVSDISVELDKEGYAEYEVLLESKKDDETIKGKAVGQITVQDEKSLKKVTSFYLGNIVELKDNENK